MLCNMSDRYSYFFVVVIIIYFLVHQDKGSGKDVLTVWKLDDPETMRKERAQKEAAKMEKEAAKLEMARAAAEREARARVPPQEMFLSMTDLYAAFDAEGMPTTDKAGEPLSKGVLKKLAKEYAKQKEAHEKYLAKVATSTAPIAEST